MREQGLSEPALRLGTRGRLRGEAVVSTYPGKAETLWLWDE